MNLKEKILIFFLISSCMSWAQSVDVQAEYNGAGDCEFIAYNNSLAPVFLYLNFANLQNTTFNEALPYVKRLEPGFNSLFTLQRNVDSDVPRFTYDIKTYHSNPMAIVDLEFPYLIPFNEGEEVGVYDVAHIDGFMGSKNPDLWLATGFQTKAGADVYACRTGVVVEVAQLRQSEQAQGWYNAWEHTISILHEDGTLLCYRNVIETGQRLKVGQKIFAGQILGEVASGKDKLELLLYHHSVTSNRLVFIIPKFVINKDQTGIVNSLTEYTIIHPETVCELEMTKRERKKFRKVKATRYP